MRTTRTLRQPVTIHSRADEGCGKCDVLLFAVPCVHGAANHKGKNDMGDAVTRLHDEYHDDKDHVPADKPHGNDSRQRWWVDYLHRVQSGTLIDLSDTQAVVRSHSGFAIVAPKNLYRSYQEACAIAVENLGKIQHQATITMSALLCDMAKAAKGSNA